MLWEWYDDNNMVKLFIHILLSANHTDNYYQGKLIKRGQLKTSISKLYRQTNLSVQTVRTCLEKLKNTK